MEIRHILFDLDGTLLPMKQDEFVKFYMPLLAKAYVTHGVAVDGRMFINAVWKGYEAMVKNDGRTTNKEVFWEYLDELLPIPRAEADALAEQFYDSDFNQAIAVTQPTPTANAVVKAAKEKGIQTYLATNPIFPRCATMNRIRWAGLDAADFRTITTYEDNCYCKPNLIYFRSIIDQFQLNPAECLMVGNDVEEDLVVRQLGVRTFLVTNTIENKKNLPVESDYMGTIEELLTFVNELDSL